MDFAFDKSFGLWLDLFLKSGLDLDRNKGQSAHL